MNVDTNIINEFFDVTFYWDGDVPKFKITLKDNKKITDTIPYKIKSDTKKIPYSSVQREYYEHYISDSDLAEQIWIERKKLCSKSNLIKWWIESNDLSKTQTLELRNYIDNCNAKLSKSLKDHYNSAAGEKTREKLKKRSKKWAPVIGNINSKKWEDEEWKRAEMQRRDKANFYENVAEKNSARMDDPEYKERFMKAVNDPARIKKISEASKKNWKKMKRLKNDKYYNIIHSGSNKNYELNSYKMNEIEFILGSLLNSLNIEWDYEKDFNFKGKVYIPDFYIESRQLIIECYGDFWHANPMLYESEDVMFKTKTAQHFWEQDDKRQRDFKKNGYNFLCFWEHDIRNNLTKIKQEICLNI